ncbi:MAG: CBS domain-containing protein [Nitrosopumilaceae archaeon]|nr:CBS domain-containing protein [Nitrosopumilaceae archaeon]NIU00915.1 CBS domain-containing protein [Nitrosopumilaceae archaeon]NIU87368.1 CBS domain-containing protein [Nitrosopumilaceae archaeon]NIV65896.1 CBS domain-containing protein [Nitrosopumilaceae archaeon]NIX61517.1 CBS domain-containing protein [Nitrosopumilaceae archaeon]
MRLRNPNLNQIMIKKPISVSTNTSLLEARDIILRHKISRLIVLGSQSKPVGIITEKDLAKTMYTLGDKPIKSVKVGGFMSKNLITVEKGSSVYNVAKLMRKHKISSIIVLEKDKKLAGIITKTDLASVFLTQATESVKITKVMTRKVITCMPEDSLLYVESLLINNRISRIVVVRDKKPVGIITYRDFVPARLPHWISQTADPNEVEAYKMEHHIVESNLNQMSNLLQFRAVDIMSPAPITVDSNEDVGVAVLLMVRNRISGLPVVKNTNLVGIITKADVVKAISKN